MDRVVFEEKIPVAFEPELFENEDLIPIPSICLTWGGIQNYIAVPVLNRSNHDIILPPNMSPGLINQVQSITSIEHNRKRKAKVNSKKNIKWQQCIISKTKASTKRRRIQMISM